MNTDRIYFISSEVVGWVYFVCWTVSFYPQVYINFKLKSVAGFSIDFLLYNILGYGCYVVFTCTLYWNKTIRDEYVAHEHTRHRDVPVISNDVGFALHGLFITMIQSWQVMSYDRGTQKVSKVTLLIVGMITLFLGSTSIACAVDALQWYWFITMAGYVKLAMSCIKAIPQAYLNFKRKSTVGFPIEGVFGDFLGGVLAIVQQLIYCVWYQDNTELFGNLPKFLLSVESLLLDTVFYWQHYVFYFRQQPRDTRKQVNEEDKSHIVNVTNMEAEGSAS